MSPGTTPNSAKTVTSHLEVSIIISRSAFVCSMFWLWAIHTGKYDSLRAPVFPYHSWRCIWQKWFADLSKQSRLHCQNFLSIWTTITLFRIKAACISIYIHKASLHAAEIWDGVVYYSTNTRGWNIHASCFGLAVGWNGCGTLTLFSKRLIISYTWET